MRNITIEKLKAYALVNAEGCWEWQRARQSSGYGVVWDGSKVVLVHRLAVEMSSGPSQPGQYALHSCDNPPCFNPEHLRWGSPHENSMDSVSRGHASGGGLVGSMNQHAKLVESDIPKILEMRSQGLIYREIAEQFGVSISAIHLVCKRRNWAHIQVKEVTQ